MPLSTANVVENDVYYTEEFKTLIRSHRDFLIANTQASVELDTSMLFAFKNDFYGYLRAKGVPPKLWWVCAYLTGIKTPFQDISRLEKWYYPDADAIDRIISRSNTVRS
jgi:hypothetical protein